MIWEAILILVGALSIVIAGSYIGGKMALRAFFGQEFVDSKSGEFVLPDSARDDTTDNGNQQ
ncbi:hypothetical protein CP556_00385 [Natrinema sp. CBA1119]|uniref:hypothetical protein n=1 Tax=Natrinema sp. CBA1119 TaxID=1608465 RepID=UPI000BF7642F|nr:hypothetical protein [Natrinema sp. CBA1119]PGF14724.1 hypothetical protein CP556_00385 [Natrinema sp. CBA1119]